MILLPKGKHLYDRIISLQRVGLWCLTPLSTIFQLYIVAVSFIGGETGVHGGNLPQVTDKHYYIMFDHFTKVGGLGTYN